MASTHNKINSTQDAFSQATSFVSIKKTETHLKVDTRSQQTFKSEQTSPGGYNDERGTSDQFELDQGPNKKKGKKSKRKGIGSSEEASGGCCFGIFGGNSKNKKKSSILPEVKEEKKDFEPSPIDG